MNSESIARYSRQLLLSNVGVQGQQSLMESKVLVVGAGGLGSPCLMYLAAGGVGHLGIVDYDQVELSNLQRQVIHSESRVGVNKAESAKIQIQELNSMVQVSVFPVLLDRTNARDIVSQFGVVVDCTDNVATRYLLNDCCVLLKKPLVSAGALRMDGQLTVYNYQNSPCYRCLFPTPPAPEQVTNCNDGGVLGVVTGIVGSIQALEVIKICMKQECAYQQKMLLVDAQTGQFRSIKLRPKNPNCPVCGDNPTIVDLIDYVQFCKQGPNDKAPSIKVLGPEKRISTREYQQLAKPHFLLDVRPQIQFDICSLPNATNIPLDRLESNISRIPKNTPVTIA
ncbi:hypothetical protein EDD86DRAFT_248853 [Gorgonomyces haynaldii]|nr:hypothetical protein EDD86DRAFT_248853 [Gorgonomyces haynaldii]